MCGIVGYVGKNKCKQTILEGLSRLEYRGYDSAGFVCIDKNHKRLSFFKEIGSVSNLKEELEKHTNDGFVGIGHTRWATHGEVNEFFMGQHNPILLKIPPGVMHGFKGIGQEVTLMVNVPTELYRYDDPDEYRLPAHTDEIPYDWSRKDR